MANMTSSERFANTLPFSGVKDGHDALLVAIHTFFIEAGYRCIGIGEEISDLMGDHSTEALPQGWNDARDVYALQYKQSSSFERKYLLKALRLGTGLAIHVLGVAKGDSFDLTVDTKDFVTTDNEELLQHIYDYPRVIRDLSRLEQLFKTDILNKMSVNTDKATPSSSSAPTNTTRQPNRPVSRNPPDDEDPLRVRGRHPHNPRQWFPPEANDPFGFGDADRLPGHPGHGGMFMDPFHQRHRRPDSNFAPPGLPRGAVPPGARFDPFGPDGDMGRNPRSGRFSGPGPDHLRPPGFEDDMFM